MNKIQIFINFKKHILLFFSIFILSCSPEQDRVYTYQENRIASPLENKQPTEAMMANMTNILPTPQQSVQVEWTTPDTWIEEPGSGFRLATFTNEDDKNSIQVSIVQLSGPAGGLRANIERWMGQINLTPLNDSEMDSFVEGMPSFQTRTGEVGYYVDLTGFNSSDNEKEQSILASIIETDQATIFVKMSGAYEDIIQSKDAFEQLNQSIQLLNNE